MIKTGDEIESDIYKLLCASSLKTAITGEIYPEDQRPNNSEEEDAVVLFLAGRGEQVQEGVVIINIYVKDIIGSGRKVKNGPRCNALGQVLRDVILGLPTEEYDFSNEQTIKTYPADVPDQHYVSARLHFQRITT